MNFSPYTKADTVVAWQQPLVLYIFVISARFAKTNEVPSNVAFVHSQDLLQCKNHTWLMGIKKS